jgi:predicted GNAT superfamily acetyltransferase
MTDGIYLRPIKTPQDMAQVEEIQRMVWPGSETDIVPAHLLLAVVRNGGLAIGAFEDQRLIGYVLGFLGTDAESPDRPAMARLKHYSHMMGVHPEYRDRGVGFKLKCAQRDAVIDQGVRLVTWTYDPLQSRNAHLNIRKLGAVSHRYIRDFYGDMRDALNVGYPSDRFQVEWWVTSSRVKERLAGNRKPLDLANFLGGGAKKVNPATLGKDDLLYPSDQTFPVEGMLILVEIVPDIARVKVKDLDLAQAWREHTREIFEEAFAKNYIVTDFIYLGGEQIPRSYYVLSYGEAKLG